jgi:hypothetical protein
VPNDIQFASGLVANKDRLYVTYGVEDCVSGLIVLKNFLSKQKQENDAPPVLALHLHPTEHQRQRVVRWEGPVRDTSSFSTVSRELGSRYVFIRPVHPCDASHRFCDACCRLLDVSIEMEFHDTSQIPSLSTIANPRFHDVIANVLLHNVQLLRPPEVIIRMSW